jgi:hypothetical protein
MAKTYTDIAANLPAYREMAKLIRMSQMIPGVIDEDMAFVVLMECEVTGQTLFQWAQENHIVGTRPTMKYDAMIAAYNALPGCRCKLIQKTPDVCAIELVDGDQSQRFTLTWDELQKEAVVYNGKESEVVAMLAAGKSPKLKDKYATPRSRAVMMYARLVSDAIRSTRPEVTKGKYTPEEVEDFDDVRTVQAESVKSVEPQKLVAPKVEAKPDPKPEAKTEQPGVEPAKTAEASTLEVKPEPIADPEPASDSDVNPLTNEPAGESSRSMDDPATDDQIATIKTLLGDLKKAGVDLFGAVKAKLAAAKINGLAGLTYGEADSLRVALECKTHEQWMETLLKGHSAPS